MGLGTKFGQLCLSGAAVALPIFSQQALAAQDSNADTALAEIVVTATKSRATALQDTAIAVSAYAGDLLDKTQVNSIRNLVTSTPSVFLGENSGHAILTIRGIGSSNVFTGSDPSSAVYLDGVYIARPYSQIFNLYNIERVEVVRGPQGTLYGRNSSGGAINIISTKPNDDLSAKAQIAVGNYQLIELQGVLNLPLVPDKLAMSVAGQYRVRDGFVKNVVPGVRDVQSDDSHSVRAQLRYASDVIEAVTRFDYSKQTGVPGSYTALLQPLNALTDSILGDFKKTAHDSHDSQRVVAWGISEDINVKFDDNLSFRSITAYRDNDAKFLFDSDSSNLHNTESALDDKSNQFSQEFNLIGNFKNLELVSGVYFFREKAKAEDRVFVFPTNLVRQYFPVVKTESWAVFAQGSYRIDDNLSLTLGGRYTWEKKDIDQYAGTFLLPDISPLPGSPAIYEKSEKYRAFTPKFGIEYRYDSGLVYASVTRGFKSGGYNFSSLDPNQGFGPEYLWSYEAGIKKSWFGRSLTTNISAFHYDYSDLQVTAALGGGIINIGNAASADVDGIEFEFDSQPLAGLRVAGNFSWLDARFVDFPGALSLTNQPFNAAGNRLPFASKYSGSISGQYEIAFDDESSLTPRLEVNWKSKTHFHTTNTQLLSQKAFTLANAYLTYEFKNRKMSTTLWAKNIFDKEYSVNRTHFTARYAAIVGEPRTFGISIDFAF